MFVGEPGGPLLASPFGPIPTCMSLNAGSISKRQFANAFHVSRVDGNRPLRVVHDAFAHWRTVVPSSAARPPHPKATANVSTRDFAVGLTAPNIITTPAAQNQQ